VTNRWTTNGTPEDGDGYDCPGANTGPAFGHRHRSPSGRASGTVWRWRNDRSFASEVDLRQAQRRQSIHDELDAGVIESMRMLWGSMADTEICMHNAAFQPR
jgi:hypothetical protein